MTQPNDTQAPERIWAVSFRLTQPMGAFQTEPCHAPEYIRADLAAAQTAAAWIAGRDAAVADVRESWEEGVPPAEFSEWAEQVEPPADASTALDALIAERVDAMWRECLGALPELGNEPVNPGWVLKTFMDKMLAIAARASKEGV